MNSQQIQHQIRSCLYSDLQNYVDQNGCLAGTFTKKFVVQDKIIYCLDRVNKLHFEVEDQHLYRKRKVVDCTQKITLPSIEKVLSGCGLFGEASVTEVGHSGLYDASSVSDLDQELIGLVSDSPKNICSDDGRHLIKKLPLANAQKVSITFKVSMETLEDTLNRLRGDAPKEFKPPPLRRLSSKGKKPSLKPMHYESF